MSKYSLTFEQSDETRGQLVIGGSVHFGNVAEVFTEGERLLSRAGLLTPGSQRTQKGPAKCITIDVSKLESAQSVVLSLLLRWLDTASVNGNKVVISGMSEKMFKMTEVTGLDAILPIQR